MFHIIFIENINIITTPPAHHIWTPTFIYTTRYLNTRKSHISVCLALFSLLTSFYSCSFALFTAFSCTVYIRASYVYYTKVFNWMVCLLGISVRPIYKLRCFSSGRVPKLLKKRVFSVCESFKLESNKSSFDMDVCVTW